MLLKAAYFRLDGKRATDPITLRELKEAQGYAIRTLGIGWGGGNLHDLNRWAELLVKERLRRGSPYPPSFGTVLMGQVASIYENWREHIRYRTNRPRPGEVASTFRAVAWLMANDLDL